MARLDVLLVSLFHSAHFRRSRIGRVFLSCLGGERMASCGLMGPQRSNIQERDQFIPTTIVPFDP